jgi:hypothetical protein
MKYRSIIIIVLSYIFILGCDDTRNNPSGTGNNGLTGNINGFVNLLRSDGSRAPDLSGAIVNLDGTSLSAITDTNGKWVIPDITAGIYTIKYTKDGYGTYVDMNRQFVGGGNLYFGKITLAQPPDFFVTIDSLKTSSDSNSLTVVGVATGMHSAGFYRVLIALGKTPDISASDPTKYIYTVPYSGIYNTTVKVNIFQSDLRQAGFISGTQAYVIMYPLSYGLGTNYTAYTDQETGRLIYTSLGKPSAILPVTIP